MNKTLTQLLLVCLVCCISSKISAQINGNITEPQVWLRADMDTTQSKWSDISGHDNHAQTGVRATTTEKVLFNYNPTRHFDEGATLGAIPFSLEGLSETTFMVVYQSSDTVERGIIGTKNGTERNVMVTTNRVLGPDSVIDVFAQGNKYLSMNTITQSWEEAKLPGDGASLTLAGIINKEDVKDFEGVIAEVLVFDEIMPFLHKVQYETYLGIKYGVSLKERNYVSSGEQVLWKADENEEYSHRITGLGRDDHFELYQKQSRNSADTTDFMLMSLGDPQKDNASNKSMLYDQDFILWGDNNKELVDHKGEGEDSVLSMLDRKWLVTVNGPTASDRPVNLQVDISQMPKDSLGFWLVVDRSGTGNFSADNLEYIKADSVSQDSIAFYNNLTWDKDKSGKDNFSFARMQDLFAVVRTVNKPICKDPKTGVVRIDVIAGDDPFDFTWELADSDNEIRYSGNDSLVIEGLEAGTYNLQVRDSKGIIFKRAKVLEMVDGIPIDLGPDQSLEDKKEIVLDASQSIPDSVEVTYDWESSFGFSSTKGKVTVTESGIYRVFITNQSNGCVFTDEVTISGSSINRFEVFPNLINRNETFNVSISLEEAQAVQLRFFDLKGNLHAELKGDNNSEYQFQVSLSKSGHYMVVLETPDGSRTKRIIVY